MAIQHLRTRDSRWDMRSYVAIHMSLIFAVATLITGSIWAKGSWGTGGCGASRRSSRS